MALSATLSSPVSTTQVGYQIPVYINLANSGGSDIVVQRIIARINETGITADQTSRSRALISVPPNSVAPAGSSSNFLMEVVFHAPSLGSTYDLGCLIYMTDGTIVTPSPITVTVTIPPGDIGA